jgi:hypothetical protein
MSGGREKCHSCYLDVWDVAALSFSRKSRNRSERIRRLTGVCGPIRQAVPRSEPTGNVIGDRDSALLATLAYICSWFGAVVNLKVEDYFQNGRGSVLRLNTKSIKEHDVLFAHQAILDIGERILYLK